VAIGSDRDAAMDKGFSHAFPVAQQLSCKKHVEDNIKKKLTDLGISGDARASFLNDIFGKDSKQEKGLVDSLSKEQFDAKLLAIRTTWDERECKARKTVEPKFFDYFSRNIAISMKERMLFSIRRNAGLGDNFYYNNSSESMNDRLKKRIRQIKRDAQPSGNAEIYCSLSEMVDVYKELVDECRRNIHRAIIDLGPYRLDESVANSKVSAEKWRDLTDAQKEKKIQIIDPLFKIQVENAPHSSQKNIIGCFEESGLPGMFKESWNKANVIIERKGVQGVPGTDKTKVVISLGNPEAPHLVKGSDKWKMIICDCKGFEKNSLCHHTLAVAHCEGTFRHIISSWKPNLSRQINRASKYVGQKPGPKRKRHPPVQRQVDAFSERTQVTTNCSNEKFSVIFLAQTKATTCYGCSGKFRQSASDPPPPAPWDMVLRRKEFRVFQPKGSDILKISAKKEHVYYHVRKQCILKKVESISANDVNIQQDLINRFGRLHKAQLRKELGIAFDE